MKVFYENKKMSLLFFYIASLLLFFPGNMFADDLFMYCGAGLRQPVDEILNEYRKKTGENVIVEFGGSGQLLSRYNASQKGDLFLPGSHFYTDKLEKAGKLTASYPLVLHVPVVVVNRGAKDKIKNFEDLAKPNIRVGLGDPKAMALGRIAVGILDNSGLKDEILKNRVVSAATVKQLTLYVSLGNVDAAIIAKADAFQNKDSLVYFEINKEWYNPEIVKIAVLKTSEKAGRSKRVAEYFHRPESIQVFVKYGFMPVK